MNKTPISILQVLMVERKKSLPDYVIECCDDKPGANFKCFVNVDKINAVGYGTTKKEAKQNGAEKALKLLGFTVHQTSHSMWDETSASPSSASASAFSALVPSSQRSTSFVNYIGKLNEYASTNALPYPTYVDNMATVGFVSYCTFLTFNTEGYGAKKKDSKQDAARRMLERVRTEDVSSSITGMMEELHVEKREKIEKLNDEILKKYNNISSPSTNISCSSVNIHIKPKIKEIITLEDLKRELQKYDLKYTVETFQKNPYIVMMKVTGSSITIMGKGDTKDEALTDLYETACHMFSNGIVVSDGN